MREAVEAKAERDSEAVVRERAGEKAKANEKDKITKITAEYGGRANAEAI